MKLRSTLRSERSADDPGTDCFVLGGGQLGLAIASGLRTAGHGVTFVDADVDATTTVQDDPSKMAALCDAGMTDAATVVVATPDDGRNLLIAQLVRTRFDVTDVFVVVHAPDRAELVAEAGHEPICATTILADAVVAGVTPRLDEVNAA